ncbi:unnamed protein product [Mytilus coruscus]|uniref:Uncharacterized protein n=1 Tax=Mytilus coruscus TaxID=42192 RepID=A0A6J8BX68_MYTCO|nr:unnamed protein product [Mytilus coruscus]
MELYCLSIHLPERIFSQLASPESSRESLPTPWRGIPIGLKIHTVNWLGILNEAHPEHMPTQRSRMTRRVATTDLRDVDPVQVIPDIVAPQPRRRKRARADTTQVAANLRDVDPVQVILNIVAPQPRWRQRARADTTQVAADQPVPSVTQPAESLPQIPSTHPSADQIAVAMISQLK